MSIMNTDQKIKNNLLDIFKKNVNKKIIKNFVKLRIYDYIEWDSLKNLRLLDIKNSDFVILYESYNASTIHKLKKQKQRFLNDLIDFFKDVGFIFTPTFTYKFN